VSLRLASCLYDEWKRGIWFQVSFGLNSDVGGGPEGGLTDVAIEVLHLLLTYLLYTPQKDVGIGEDQKQAFLNTLRKGER
jgi:hypothetical protein